VLSAAIEAGKTEDVLAKLTGTCRFSQIDQLDISGSTPDLATIMSYDAAFYFSSQAAIDPTTLGNELADFVDAGHRVVVAFAGYHDSYPGIYGRLRTDGYLPFTTSLVVLNGTTQTLVADMPDSPLLAGVAFFSGGTTSWREEVALAPGAIQIAHWNDAASTPLVAAKGGVVGLNFFPPSADNPGDPGCWDPTTDGATLTANALTKATYATGLSIRAPRAVTAGTSVLVAGKLSCDEASCATSQQVTPKAGTRKITRTTSAAGRYAFSFRVMGTIQVRTFYAGSQAICAHSTSVKKTIRVA